VYDHEYVKARDSDLSEQSVQKSARDSSSGGSSTSIDVQNVFSGRPMFHSFVKSAYPVYPLQTNLDVHLKARAEPEFGSTPYSKL
jgi:hypothetical protein